MSDQQTPEQKLAALVGSVGGADELVALVADYRKIVGALATSTAPGRVLADVRCWFSRKSLLRIAVDLPDEQGRAFLGRE